MEEIIFNTIRAEAGENFLKCINVDKLAQKFDLSHEEVYAVIKRKGYKYGLQIGTITKAGLLVKPY